MNAHLKALLTVIIVGLIGTAAGIFLLKGKGESENLGERAVASLPIVSMKTIGGTSIQTAQYKGHVVIVNFWASWCGPCVEEVPSLIRLSKAMSDKLKILAISGDNSLEDISVFLKSFPEFKRPGIDIVYDQDISLQKQFDVMRLPESFIFDSEGKMVRKVTGSIDWSTPEAVEYIKHLLL